MARYFFDTDDGELLMLDLDGHELGSRDEVWRMALDALPDVAQEESPDGDVRVLAVMSG